MPSYPLSPYPPSLDFDQYDLLWNVVWKGKILLVRHAEPPGALITGLVKLGYIDATPRLSSPEARSRCQARLEECYDQLAAIARSEWPARHEEAKRLFDSANYDRWQLIGSEYHVSEAGRRLVLEWEHARQA